MRLSIGSRGVGPWPRRMRFVRWLAARKKEYPTLVEYLSRPSFKVKNCKRTIYNTWAGLLSPTTVAQRAAIEAYDLAA